MMAAEGKGLDQHAVKTHTRKPLLDAAATITVASAALYALGVTYWIAYYRFFGVSLDLVEFDFLRTLSTTWLLIFIFAAFGGMGFFYGSAHHRAITVGALLFVSLPVVFMFSFLLPPVFSFLLALKQLYQALAGIVLSIVLVTVVSRFVPLEKEVISLDKVSSLTPTRALITAGGTFLLLAGLYYGFGTLRAHFLVERPQSRITLVLDGQWQPPPKLILVAHTAGKYVAVDSAQWHSRQAVLIIDDTRVLRAELEPSASSR